MRICGLEDYDYGEGIRWWATHWTSRRRKIIDIMNTRKSFVENKQAEKQREGGKRIPSSAHTHILAKFTLEPRYGGNIWGCSSYTHSHSHWTQYVRMRVGSAAPLHNFFFQHIFTIVKFHLNMCKYRADHICDIWMSLSSSCFFMVYQFVFFSLWFTQDYSAHIRLLIDQEYVL